MPPLRHKPWGRNSCGTRQPEQAFDKFDPFRRDGDLRSYRVTRAVDGPQLIFIDLDVDSPDAGATFASSSGRCGHPQSQPVLVEHQPPRILAVVDRQTF